MELQAQLCSRCGLLGDFPNRSGSSVYPTMPESRFASVFNCIGLQFPKPVFSNNMRLNHSAKRCLPIAHLITPNLRNLHVFLSFMFLRANSLCPYPLRRHKNYSPLTGAGPSKSYRNCGPIMSLEQHRKEG